MQTIVVLDYATSCAEVKKDFHKEELQYCVRDIYICISV